MRKDRRLANYLDRHEYPPILYRFPIITRCLYTVNLILTLRNWYVLRALKKTEKKQYADFSFLDAGCGMGEFALGVARRHPDARVVGIDFTASNIPLAKRMAQSMHLTNIEFREDDVTTMNTDSQYHLILCNSSLQFIKEDERALRNLHEMLKPQGTLLVYVPITYKRYFPRFENIENKYLSAFFYKYHDDFLMHRYRADEIVDKIKEAGFSILGSEYAYGIYGAIAFELYSLILVAAKKLHSVVYIPLVLIYACMVIPVQLLLMLADFLLPKSFGNGLLIVAGKPDKS